MSPGLMRLSNALAEAPAAMSKSGKFRDVRTNMLTILREWDLNRKQLGAVIVKAIGMIVEDPRFSWIDTNIPAAMLYLQVQDPFVKNIVMRYLRTQRIPGLYRNYVPALVSTRRVSSPIQILAELAKVMRATENRILVLCVDELDNILEYPDPAQSLNKAVTTLTNISAAIPSSIVIVSCLENLYYAISEKPNAPNKFKIETPPSPVVLESLVNTKEEIDLLVGKRLNVLFDEMNAKWDENEPVFPFPKDELENAPGSMRDPC
jgi:hypothetical protein